MTSLTPEQRFRLYGNLNIPPPVSTFTVSSRPSVFSPVRANTCFQNRASSGSGLKQQSGGGLLPPKKGCLKNSGSVAAGVMDTHPKPSSTLNHSHPHHLEPYADAADGADAHAPVIPPPATSAAADVHDTHHPVFRRPEVNVKLSLHTTTSDPSSLGTVPKLSSSSSPSPSPSPTAAKTQSDPRLMYRNSKNGRSSKNNNGHSRSSGGDRHSRSRQGSLKPIPVWMLPDSYRMNETSMYLKHFLTQMEAPKRGASAQQGGAAIPGVFGDNDHDHDNSDHDHDDDTNDSDREEPLLLERWFGSGSSPSSSSASKSVPALTADALRKHEQVITTKTPESTTAVLVSGIVIEPPSPISSILHRPPQKLGRPRGDRPSATSFTATATDHDDGSGGVRSWTRSTLMTAGSGTGTGTGTGTGGYGGSQFTINGSAISSEFPSEAAGVVVAHNQDGGANGRRVRQSMVDQWVRMTTMEQARMMNVLESTRRRPSTSDPVLRVQGASVDKPGKTDRRKFSSEAVSGVIGGVGVEESTTASSTGSTKRKQIGRGNSHSRDREVEHGESADPQREGAKKSTKKSGTFQRLIGWLGRRKTGSLTLSTSTSSSSSSSHGSKMMKGGRSRAGESGAVGASAGSSQRVRDKPITVFFDEFPAEPNEE